MRGLCLVKTKQNLAEYLAFEKLVFLYYDPSFEKESHEFEEEVHSSPKSPTVSCLCPKTSQQWQTCKDDSPTEDSQKLLWQHHAAVTAMSTPKADIHANIFFTNRKRTPKTALRNTIRNSMYLHGTYEGFSISYIPRL